MKPLTQASASILAATTFSMMLFIMNARNPAYVRWGALAIAAAGVAMLAFSKRSTS